MTIRLKGAQCLAPAAARRDLVALGLEHAPKHRHESRIVVDDQDAAAGRWKGVELGGHRRLSLGDGELEDEPRPMAARAFDVDTTAATLHDAVGYRQSQPHAGLGLRSEEWLEDPASNLRAHPHPAIHHL